MPVRLGTLLLLTAAACVAATLAVDLTPALQFAYDNSALHVALETTATLVGLVASFLLLGRVQRTRFLDELTLACGFTLLAFSNFLFAMLPSVFDFKSNDDPAWGGLIAGTTASILICTSPLLPRRPLSLSSRAAFRVSLGVASALMLMTAALVGGLRGSLPPLVRTFQPASGDPRLIGHPVVLGTQLGLAALYAIATYGFYRRYKENVDELSGWFAGASLLAGASRLNYFLYPSLYSKWVYSGDVFRLSFYLVLLIGAGREVISYWSSAVRAAQLDERRRVARDLHDGLAQEIAFIARNADSG